MSIFQGLTKDVMVFSLKKDKIKHKLRVKIRNMVMPKNINEKFVETVIDRMWMVLGENRFRGLTPYEVARKMGLNHEGAKKVEKLWNGPKKF